MYYEYSLTAHSPKAHCTAIRFALSGAPLLLSPSPRHQTPFKKGSAMRGPFRFNLASSEEQILDLKKLLKEFY